jgi:lipopolysaccharide heptosyltransferase I
MKLLFVRLGSLGDIIHTVPAVAAVGGAFPQASINWLVDVRQLEVLELVEGIDRIHPLRPDAGGWISAVPALRRERFDVALDFQGLIKSALLARLAGAKRTIGFAKAALREPLAAAFYTETCRPAEKGHVIEKNLSLLSALNVKQPAAPSFRFAARPSAALQQVVARTGGRFALVNPGAAWPNKRWPPDRFGAVAAEIRRLHGLSSIVLWGPGERELADAVVARSAGAATAAPPTSIADLFALCGAASLMLSGDTGPLHIGAAVGTPLVGLFGPTDARRNGPWSASDVSVSRFLACGCHHQRRCTQPAWCLNEIEVAEVMEAVGRRLAGAAVR